MNEDLDLDQRILYRAAQLMRLADRWWAWPARRLLRAWGCEFYTWAREARKHIRALDEIADDEREQMQLAMREVVAYTDPRAELEQCLARWKPQEN